MEKSSINFKQTGQVILWEIRKQYYSMRYLALACLALLFIVLLLPQSACQYLDEHAKPLVNIINFAFAASFIVASFALTFRQLTVPYGSIEYQKERASAIPIPVRLGIRLLVNTLLCGFTLLYLVCASNGMAKFADANHSYLFFEYREDNFFYTYLIYYVLISLMFLTLFLRRYVMDHDRYYFFPFVLSSIGGSLVSQLKDSMFRTFTNWPIALIHIVFTLIVLILCVLLFCRCCHYEKEL